MLRTPNTTHKTLILTYLILLRMLPTLMMRLSGTLLTLRRETDSRNLNLPLLDKKSSPPSVERQTTWTIYCERFFVSNQIKSFIYLCIFYWM
ncbi:hypothetical protein DFH28DRAFT_997288 [Melampsora americana]|nr:hypothetical protein DFH28DRAFT_997288 [Melampsora americana]